MRKIVEWIMSLFFSKEAIDIVRREAADEARTEVTKYENKKYLSKLKKGSRYKKAPAH
jgi:hypothetical protein